MPKRIEIPFDPEMVHAAIYGIVVDNHTYYKRKTTRRKILGYRGDWFYIGGYMFVITDVAQLPLKTVQTYYYRDEGTASPEAFEKLWKRLHHGNWDPEGIYNVHCFRPEKESRQETIDKGGGI